MPRHGKQWKRKIRRHIALSKFQLQIGVYDGGDCFSGGSTSKLNERNLLKTSRMELFKNVMVCANLCLFWKFQILLTPFKRFFISCLQGYFLTWWITNWYCLSGEFSLYLVSLPGDGIQNIQSELATEKLALPTDWSLLKTISKLVDIVLINLLNSKRSSFFALLLCSESF